jgi:predicted nucleotide-binding protein
MDMELEGRIAQGQELVKQIQARQGYVRRGLATLGAGQPPEIYPPSNVALRDKCILWDEYNVQLLRSRFSTGRLASEYRTTNWFGQAKELGVLADRVKRKVWKLGAIRERLSLYESVEKLAIRDGSVSPYISDKIFIVHGHDGDTKLQVAEFVERITGERPVILHEQADSGRTVIEKFEEHASEAGFAIILLTADDAGKAKNAPQLNLRARQNVVLEFGYFMAKLGRSRVVALYEAGVELPSDVSGVLYKSLAGNWHTGLAQELKAAGIEIDFSKLF